MNTTRIMPNGATVADWLGTASIAAKCAADEISATRKIGVVVPDDLDIAEAYLTQALDELAAIRAVMS